MRFFSFFSCLFFSSPGSDFPPPRSPIFFPRRGFSFHRPVLHFFLLLEDGFFFLPWRFSLLNSRSPLPYGSSFLFFYARAHFLFFFSDREWGLPPPSFPYRVLFFFVFFFFFFPVFPPSQGRFVFLSRLLPSGSPFFPFEFDPRFFRSDVAFYADSMQPPFQCPPFPGKVVFLEGFFPLALFCRFSDETSFFFFSQRVQHLTHAALFPPLVAGSVRGLKSFFSAAFSRSSSSPPHVSSA